MTGESEAHVPDSLIDAVLERIHGRLHDLPERVGRYRVIGLLGKGGMGRVLLGSDGDRRVAIKTVGVPWTDSSDAIRRLEREAVALASLRHPGICRVLDLVRVGETPHIIMEYVDGATLSERLAEEDTGITSTDWVAWMEQTARALHAAHRQGIFHRDVKPSNIMVRADGRAVLVDFGLVSSTGLRDEQLQSSRLVLGTRPYMAPELLDPRNRGDTRSDIWSLGVTLYEVLNGRPPFRAASENELAAEIFRARIPRCRRRPDLRRADVDAVLRAALARDPEQRYPSALAMAEDLQRLRAGLPVLAGQRALWARAWDRAKRRPGRILGSLAIALAAAMALRATAVVLAGRNDAVLNGLEARTFELRERLARARARYDTLLPGDDGPAAAVRRMREWLASDAAMVSRIAGELADKLESMRPELATLARETIAEARTLDAEESTYARDRIRQIERQLLAGPDPTWSAAIAANPGVLDRPQLDLVPIGRDPSSHLWEFAHIPSGDPPTRDAAGRLLITRETGLVFVLVPGGSFRMLSGEDGNEQHWISVRLDPFFLSKYEMSRDQWTRLARRWPLRMRTEDPRSTPWRDPAASRMPASPFGEATVLPVFNVGWVVCEELLRRVGLELPTEAQWEMAARGGTSPGLRTEERDLDPRLAANFRGGQRWRDDDDGPMPVDSLRPNPFGFHHLPGNVWEWCRDAADPYAMIEGLRDGDGLQAAPPDREREFRVDRGGSFWDPSVGVGSRNAGDSRCVWINEGVRPARRLDR